MGWQNNSFETLTDVVILLWIFTFLKCFFIKDFIFTERREKEEKHRCVRETPIGCLSYAPNQGPGWQPGMCPDWDLNW